MVTGGATPLLSVDAVVIDTETTGLDPGKARVLEFAAVRIRGGRLDATDSLRRFHCGPAAASSRSPTGSRGRRPASAADCAPASARPRR